MKNFEDELDEIRVALYEETKDCDRETVIRKVNTHAKKIAAEFGITVVNMVDEQLQMA